MDEEARKSLTVPFNNEWYRCESCEPKKRKDGWIVHFSGKVTPYKVGFDTYKDFLNLPRLWAEDLDEPRDDVVGFLRKWGPLGAWQKSLVDVGYGEGEGLLAAVTSRGIPRGTMPFEEYWMLTHTRKLRVNTKGYPAKMPSFSFVEKTLAPDSVFRDYFESWRFVFGELFMLQQAYSLIDQDDISPFVNVELSRNPLKPLLVKVPGKPKKYEWSFAFKTLSGALIGLLAQEVIGKVDMRECKNCGSRFDAIATGRTTFCCNLCLAEYPDKQKREDPVIRYRRMLQRRMGRRRGVSDKKSRSINAELLAEKSVDGLKTIEDKYPVILGKKK